MNDTWTSLWKPLLFQACHLSLEAVKNDPVARSASAIILARTSWESFAHELVLTRGFGADVVTATFEKSLDDKLESFGELLYGNGISSKHRFDGEPWISFRHLNSVRNKLIHHNPNGSAPAIGTRWYEQFDNDGLLVGSTKDSWERRCLSHKTAQWSCRVAGNAIIALEEVPNRRKRNLDLVRNDVYRCLAVLPGGAQENET